VTRYFFMEYLCKFYDFFRCSRVYSALDHVIRYRLSPVFGPGTVAIAGGLAKTFTLREGVRARFEATFTNLPNHPNFAAPYVDVSAPATFGKTTSVQSAENSGNRTGQLALRIDF
jgi:hypothetical protein